MANPLNSLFGKKDENNYSAIAATVLGAVGGKDNIAEVTHCVSRLRFTVKDPEKVDLKACNVAAALGVTNPTPESVQIIFGTEVENVYKELEELL